MSRTPGFRAKKRDANEGAIVELLRDEKFIVVRMDDPFDLIVQCPEFGCWHAIEVKNPDGRNQLTKNQIDDFDRMHRAPTIARTPGDALTGITEDHKAWARQVR